MDSAAAANISTPPSRTGGLTSAGPNGESPNTKLMGLKQMHLEGALSEQEYLDAQRNVMLEIKRDTARIKAELEKSAAKSSGSPA